jgi:exoribonuclease R
VSRRVRLIPPDEAAIAASFADLRESMGVVCDFPPEVAADAERAARAPRLPDRDETTIPLVTIDPPGARDLDQALHLERRGDGFRVHYAIADVAAFVAPGGPMDTEAHARGQTFYAPDRDALLYPEAISHGAASLLPDETRPAALWTIDLDARGEPVAVEVARALVRSRAQLTYEEVQAALDDGSAEEALLLLREVGTLRQRLEEERGAVDLQIPEQEIARGENGYELSFRAQLPVERWNAQLSLLTGQAAARLMLDAKVGIVRTLPRTDEGAVARLRRTAMALGVPWPEDASHADFVRSLDPAEPKHQAAMIESTVLLRGSGYEAFDGEEPENARHAGVGAPYAHATAPLRRLVDRYVSETCLALSAGEEVPPWVREALPGLPETMAAAGRREAQYEGGIVSAVEAAVLERAVGKTFEAVVVEVDRDGEGGVVQLAEPAVTARTTGEQLPLGERLRVRLEVADVAQRLVRFAPA